MGTIMVGTDGSEAADQAIRFAVEVAARTGNRINVVHVYPPLHHSEYAEWVGKDYEQLRTHTHQQARALVREAFERVACKNGGVLMDGVVECDRNPAKALIDHAREATMLVVGSRGRGGFTGLLLGSVSQQTVQQAPCPVVVVPQQQGAGDMTEDIVVGIDGSDGAQEALKWALAEAAWRQVPVRIVHAVNFPADMASPHRYGAYEYSEAPSADQEKAAVIKRGQELVETALADAGGAPYGVSIEPIVKIGSGPNLLVEQSRDAALVVVGSRGRGGFAGLLLGSVSQQTVQHAHCPVTIVPQTSE